MLGDGKNPRMLFCHSMTAGLLVGMIKPYLLWSNSFVLTGGSDMQKYLTHTLAQTCALIPLVPEPPGEHFTILPYMVIINKN